MLTTGDMDLGWIVSDPQHGTDRTGVEAASCLTATRSGDAGGRTQGVKPTPPPVPRPPQPPAPQPEPNPIPTPNPPGPRPLPQQGRP